MDEKQMANARRLLEYYKSAPAVTGWGYDQCFAGVLEDKLRITQNWNRESVIEALGSDDWSTTQMIAGPGFGAPTSTMVIASLEQYIERGDGVFNWFGSHRNADTDPGIA